MALINTLDAPGEYDAAATLREGEPYFLLVGRDRSAPPLVYQWADTHRRKVLAEFDAGTITKEKRDDELRKATEAEDIASSMVEYKNDWQAQAADKPREAPPTYTGHELPPETARRDKLVQLRARAAAALTNARAEVYELAEFIGDDPIADCPDGLALDTLVSELREHAELITPPRPLYDRK